MNVIKEDIWVYEKKIAVVLFLCIVLILIPFILSDSILKKPDILLPLLAFGFIFQIILLYFVFVSKSMRIQAWTLIVILTLVAIQLITQIILLNNGYPFYIYNFINIFAKGLNYIFLFALLLNKKISENSFILFFKLIVLLAIAACIYNIIVFRNDILNLSLLHSSYQINMQSFFSNRNQFGAFLVISIIANTFICKNKIKFYNILIFILLFISLFLTFSRTSILACGIFFISFLLMNYRYNKKIIFFSLVVIISICLLFIINKTLNSFFLNIVLRADNISTMSDRNSIWALGLNIISNQNLFSGIGYFSAQQIASSQGIYQFHSFFIDTLVSGGIIELAFVLLTIGFVIFKIKKSNMDRTYKKIFFSAFFALFTLAFLESVGFFSIGYVDTIFTIFFISIPILFSNSQNSCELKTNEESKVIKSILH